MEQALPRFLRGRKVLSAPRGLFPTDAAFASDCPDPLSEHVYYPFFARWAERFSRLACGPARENSHLYHLHPDRARGGFCLGLVTCVANRMTVLVLTAISVIAFSGVPGLLLSRNSPVGQWLAAVLAVGRALLGIVGTLQYALLGQSARSQCTGRCRAVSLR